MINDYCVSSECTGCSACASSCPQKCIVMQKDTKGFSHPIVNQKKCICCGICIKVCGQVVDQVKRTRTYPKELYAAISTDEIIRANSRSGGVFTELAKCFLRNNGWVYGAAFAPNLEVVHRGINDENSYNIFAGSKYVQSDINDCYIQVANHLMKGESVLFSGTPCQVEGLQSYLRVKKVDVSNLYTVDLICHGVGSPEIYREYLSFIKKERGGGGIVSFDFRDKSNGWLSHKESILTISREKYTDTTLATMYEKNYSLRQSCFRCKYTTLERVGDITLGDFHGIEKRTDESKYLDNKGVSCVLINSEKGWELWNECESKLQTLALKKDDIAKLGHPNLHRPTEIPTEYFSFWKLRERKGFEAVARRYGYYGKRGKSWRFIDRVKAAFCRRFQKIWKKTKKTKV